MRTSKVEKKPRVWYPDSQVKRVFTEDRATSMAHVKSRWEPRTGFSNTEVTLEVLAKHKQERDTSEMNSHAGVKVSVSPRLQSHRTREALTDTTVSLTADSSFTLTGTTVTWGEGLGEKGRRHLWECLPSALCLSIGGCSTRSDCHELWYVISFFVVFENRHRRYGR